VATIRPLERDDLPAVADLVRANLRGWNRDAGVLERNLIDHPWAENPVRSLVAVHEDGTLIGSIGAQSRRILFEGRKLEAVCVSHLAVAAERRAGAAGVLLVRGLLAGDQDITWTDSGTPGVVRIWRMLGGDIDHARTCDWMLVIRPGRWLRRVATAVASPRAWLGPATAPVRGVPLPSRSPADDGEQRRNGEIRSEDASAAEVAAELPSITRRIRLRVDHDESYLEYIGSYLEQLGLGDVLVRRLVRRGGAAIGWYAYLARPGSGRVIHVGAAAAEADAVVSALLEDARGRDIAVISGRLEPHLDEPIRRRDALLALRQQPLIHSRNPELVAAAGSSASLLTELDLIDSEWW
jgi:hypothetical protein